MSTSPARGKVCPGCGRVAPEDASLCPMCFRRLEGVEPVEIRPRTGAGARVRATGRRAVDAVEGHPRLAILAALVLVLAVFGYVRYLRPPSPVPVASSSVTATAGGDAWPGPDGGADGARATTASPPLDGTVAWTRTLSAPAVTAPVVDADGIYVGLADGRMVALDARDGSERWSRPVAGEIDSAPVVVDGTLYLAHRSGRVVAVSAASGEERWSVEAGSPVFGAPAVADGVVYVASFETLLGVDAANGRVLWRRSLDAGFIQVAPAVVGEHLLVATNAAVRFFDRRTGAEHYGFALRDAAHVSGNAAVALAFQQTVYAFEPDTQTPWWWSIRGAWANFYVLGLAPYVPAPPRRWAVTFPRGAYLPAAGADTVYVAQPTGQLVAVDAATGAERWSAILDPITAAPVLTGAGLLVATPDELVLVDRGGTITARRALNGLTVSALAVTGRMIVLQTGADAAGLAVIE